MDIWVTGGGWVTEKGYGQLSDKKNILLSNGPAVIVPTEVIFEQPHKRYGRFDDFTRMGITAVSLSLQDSKLISTNKKANMGMIASTYNDVMKTDIEYYNTAKSDGGTLSSPNLFSYTLPVIVLGECSTQFHFMGPTLCVGDSTKIGLNALLQASSMIRSGKCESMLAGWIDSPMSSAASSTEKTRASLTGSIFVTLEASPKNIFPHFVKLDYRHPSNLFLEKRELSDIVELFNKGE